MLEVILVDDDNQEYASLNGVLFSKDMKTLIRYPQGKKENTYYIPEGVVAIGDGAFMDCQNLDAINIAGTVAQINEWAFNGCPNVKQFIVPNSVKSVGSRAFDQSGMESIIFPESVEKWGSCVLWSNINLKQIEFLAENPSEDLSRCIIEDELIMPNLETIYVPYGTKGEYEGVPEEYFHSYIQEREESWNDSTPAVSPAPVTPTPSVSDKDYGKTKSEVIQNIGYAQGQTTYRYGDTGSVVLFIQDVLKQLDLYNGVVSGNFGYNTQDAVKEFQRQNGLAPDGVCGWNTIDMLIDSYLNLLEKPSTPEPTATPTPTPTPTIEPTPAFPNLGNIFGNLGSAGKYPLKRPTLILSEDGHDLLGVGYLSFEIIETSEKAITYEIDLYDAWGREIALPGECKLIFPYPEGITISNRHGWRVTITHYGEDQTTKYSSEDGSIEFLPLGLCIRVSSLSPFVIEWEKSVAPDTLPQTGDNTSLPMLALVLLLSLALIYRLNYKRINA